MAKRRRPFNRHKATDLSVTFEWLDARAELAKKGRFPKPKWIGFAINRSRKNDRQSN